MSLHLTSEQVDKLSDRLGEELSPHAHMAIAELIKSMNPKFNADKFLSRCQKSWEDKYLAPIDDKIPH
jgi:hypothetical protein